MTSFLIKGGRVLSPADSLDGQLDILVEGGTIRGIGAGLAAEADETLDAAGQVVAPGFVDIHVHFREPGGEASETLATGLRAAVAGGFTAVCPMPNTRPVNDSAELTRWMIATAKELGLSRLYPIAAVSLESEGEQLSEFGALADAGAVAFSDDGKPVKTAGLARRAFEAAARFGVPLIEHCEDATLSAEGAIDEGPIAGKLGVRGIPNTSEEVCLARDLVLAEAADAHLHVAHLSTARALELVRSARRRGVHATCEVTPHHFTLTSEAVLKYGTLAKMNPPLRSPHDVEAIIAALADGTVDAIATDHAPHAAPLKSKPLADAAFGITGLETAFGLAMTQLVHRGLITLGQLVLLMSTNPARIINQPLGSLRVGGPADLTIFNPDLEWTYRATEGRSKSRNTPFDGWTFRGAVTATIVAGRVMYRRD